jgi:predicted nucleic acid-binding Zn ribbon protein
MTELLMKMMQCSKCGTVLDADEMMGPKRCPMILSNKRRDELGMKTTKIPPHLAELGMKEEDNLGGVCNTALRKLSNEEVDTLGVKAIIHLQDMVKVKETEKTARAGWNGLNERQRQQTLLAYSALSWGNQK